MTIGTLNPPSEFVDAVFDDPFGEQLTKKSGEEPQPTETETTSGSGGLTKLHRAAARIATAFRAQAGAAAKPQEKITPENAVRAYIDSESEFFGKHPELAEAILKMERGNAEWVCLEASRLSLILSMHDYPKQSRREDLDRAGRVIFVANKMLQSKELSKEAVEAFSRAVALAERETPFYYDEDRKSDQPTRQKIAAIDVFTQIGEIERKIQKRGLRNDMEFLVDLNDLDALANGMRIVAVTATEELENEALTPRQRTVVGLLQEKSLPLSIALLKAHEEALEWHKREAEMISEAKAREILSDEIEKYRFQFVEILMTLPEIKEGSAEDQPGLYLDRRDISKTCAKYAARIGIEITDDSLDRFMNNHPEVTLGISHLHATLSVLQTMHEKPNVTQEQVNELTGALLAASMSPDTYDTSRVADLGLIQGLRALVSAEYVELRGPGENPLIVFHEGGTSIELLKTDRPEKVIEKNKRSCAELVVNRLRRMIYPGNLQGEDEEGKHDNLNLATLHTLTEIDFANSTRETAARTNEVEAES